MRRRRTSDIFRHFRLAHAITLGRRLTRERGNVETLSAWNPRFKHGSRCDSIRQPSKNGCKASSQWNGTGTCHLGYLNASIWIPTFIATFFYLALKTSPSMSSTQKSMPLDRFRDALNSVSPLVFSTLPMRGPCIHACCDWFLPTAEDVS